MRTTRGTRAAVVKPVIAALMEDAGTGLDYGSGWAGSRCPTGRCACRGTPRTT
ncbi:hypothetical protein [Microbispora bryophytorum]|uniref:hypothetical protein n=1 Tax=Microbispora bryophytorum TaxID=1460882 RepID=UPI003409CA72